MSRILVAENSSPEELNRYIDKVIKDKIDSTIDDDELQKIMGLYQSLEDKMIFQSIYELFFIKRYTLFGKKELLLEDQIIKQLRTISSSFMKSYENYVSMSEESDSLGNKFNSLSDENDQFSPIILPPSPVPLIDADTSFDFISDKIQSFKTFYEEQNAQNTIELLPEKSTVEISLQIPTENGQNTRSIDIVTDFFCAQALIKICQKPCNFGEIVSLFNNRKIALDVVLNLNKEKLIKRKGDSMKLSDNDQLSINESIDNSIKDNKIIVRYDNHQKITGHFEMRARFEKDETISSMIVRILKRRGKIEYEELVNMVIGSFANEFPCNNEMVEKQIKRLTELYLKIENENGQNIVYYTK